MIKYVLVSISCDENKSHYTPIAVFDSHEKAKYLANAFNKISRIEYQNFVERTSRTYDVSDTSSTILNDNLLLYNMLTYGVKEVNTDCIASLKNEIKIEDLHNPDIYKCLIEEEYINC